MRLMNLVPRFASAGRTASQKPSTLLTCSLLVVAMSIGISPSRAQDNPTPSASRDADLVNVTWRQQESVQGCRACHSKGPDDGEIDRSFSRQSELKYWMANDKHAIARRRVEPISKDQLVTELYKLVEELKLSEVPNGWLGESNVLSDRICTKLGFDMFSEQGQAAFRSACLTCHGGYQGAKDDVHFTNPEGPQPGISCDFCHQVGENREWISRHGIPGIDPKWRNSPPDVKAEAGMRDLVNTAAQAANCYDCHIGNRDKGMFVTHVMYAAGHPPLPSVELETFCNSMPQHWQSDNTLLKSLTAADYQGIDAYFAANYPELYGGDRPTSRKPAEVYWKTRRVLVGAIAARLHSIDLLIQSATPDRWADYSLYDCAACHHELREPSDRQQRGYVSAPGRPRQSEWQAAIINVALDVASANEDVNHRATIDASESKLALAFAQVPFGDPAIIKPTAEELRAQLQASLRAVQAKPIVGKHAREIIRRLALTPEDKLVVYDSGRQVVWAIQSIAAELAEMNEPLPAALVTKIRSLGDAAVTGIDVTLPAGRNLFIYPDHLNTDLELKNAYQPQSLTEILRQIAAEIVI